MTLSAPSVVVPSEIPSDPMQGDFYWEDFACDMVDRAIARYREASRSARNAKAQDSKWSDLAQHEAATAERFLTLTILACDPDHDDPELAILKEGPTRAVRAFGKLYIAGPLPNYHEPRDQMVLTVIDESAIIDFDTIQSDDQVEATEPATVVSTLASVLTPAQEDALMFIKKLGERETFDRLYISGAHGVIGHAIQRLGSDAVAELRRQAEEGRK
jgi:hypothetical protein